MSQSWRLEILLQWACGEEMEYVTSTGFGCHLF